MKKHALAMSLLTLFASGQSHAEAARPVVVELFTSQGCSSCPPADALLVDLARDPSIVALSFHVNYWDYLGWKDPYASAENTERQRSYSGYQGSNNVFTPQAMVGGRYSTVGSRASEVKAAIARVRADAQYVPVTLAAGGGNQAINVHIADGTIGSLSSPASVIAVRFVRNATTQVKAGENRGETLQSVNNVTAIERLGSWQNKAADFTTKAPAASGEGVAILVQNTQTGHILGSAIQ